METFLLFISTIHGCSSMRQGVALRGCSFSRLEYVVSLAINQSRYKALPALNEVFEILTPLDVIFWLIFQYWNWLSNDVGK
jgi:hypothetical protein